MERTKSKLSVFFDIVNWLEDIVLAILVIGMVAVIMIQIIGRIIGHPFPWTEESSRYLFLWMMFVALAAGFSKCESSRVTLFLQMGPAWLKKFSEILYAVIVIAFFVIMLVYGWEVVQQQIDWEEMGTALLIPMWIIGICQPIGAVLGIIGTLQNFLEFHDRVAIGDKEAEKQKALANEG
ncbi:MAG: TRAP transporter small permease [Synergistaceae bacterium]|nr:TRAP transporter small permease [Synergistaceae bacterium]MBR0094203.1 TRAP transporter small permease [Synergistaceae bacterium]